MSKQIKFLYWAFQSSQTKNPTEKELEIFQNKYKKDYEQRELYDGEELEDKFRLNSWRNPMFSEITSIILGYEHEGTLRVKYLQGTEKDLLQSFVNLLRNQFKDFQLVHFDAEIVLPYIGVRLHKNNFISPIHPALNYMDMKPWNLLGIDLKQVYKGAGKYSFSLEEIGYILNLDTEGVIPYEDEFTYYNAEDFEALNKSAIKKVELLSQIHRKLQNQSELTTLIVREKVEDVVEELPKDILKSIGLLKGLTPELTDQLKVIFKKRMSKKDKEIAFDLVKASLCDIDQNFGAVRNIKVVEEIVEQLKQELDVR